MRKLMWFAIGFTIACAVGAYWLMGSWLLYLAIGSFLCGVPFCFLKPKAVRIVAAVLIGLSVGFAWNWGYQQIFLKDQRELDGQKITATITVKDYSYSTKRGVAVDGTLHYRSKNYKVKLYIYEDISLNPGDKIKATCTFRYTGQGAKEDPTYHQGKGIFLLAYASGAVEIEEGSDAGFRYIPVRLRREIKQTIDEIFPADVAGFARALLIGDSSKLTYETNTAFTVSGIRHVVAVSGLHVAILISLIGTLCRNNRWLIAFIGLPLLFLFAALAGFTPSVMRACLMQTLLIFSVLFTREYDTATSLGFAVLVILGINPQAITSVSLQLSVACMIGIYAFNGPIHKYLLSCKWATGAAGKGFKSKILRMVVVSISVSLSVWIVTTPLCAIHFGSVSIVGILTNLLTVWLVSYIFCGIILACAMSLAWAPLGILCAWIVSWPMRFVQVVAAGLSKIPFASVYTCSAYTVAWLVFCYILLALFFVFRYHRPGMLISCMLAGLVASCAGSVVAERRIDSYMTVLNVGQGQCIILKDQGRYYMVDCGGTYDSSTADMAAEYLLSKGVYSLDGLILSHYDTDHCGSALMLMTRLNVEKIYMPNMEPENTHRQALEKMYTDRIVWVYDTSAIPQENLTMFCSVDESSGNESGICVLFQPKNCDILILGDRGRSGELELLDRTTLPKIEIMVLGHHGSNNATSFELLLQTQPDVAIISVGENSFGHPGDETLGRLERFGCRVLRTDQNGTIEFGR